MRYQGIGPWTLKITECSESDLMELDIEFEAPNMSKVFSEKLLRGAYALLMLKRTPSDYIYLPIMVAYILPMPSSMSICTVKAKLTGEPVDLGNIDKSMEITGVGGLLYTEWDTDEEAPTTNTTWSHEDVEPEITDSDQKLIVATVKGESTPTQRKQLKETISKEVPEGYKVLIEDDRVRYRMLVGYLSEYICCQKMGDYDIQIGFQTEEELQDYMTTNVQGTKKWISENPPSVDEDDRTVGTEEGKSTEKSPLLASVPNRPI